MSYPLVAIIGRPNVGKSSLFNRFLHKRLAIVDDKPGITRDRNYSLCEWAGREFFLIDTGGMLPGSKTGIEKMVLEQAEIAIEQADLVILVVDCMTGPDSTDRKIAATLMKADKKVVLMANKADNQHYENERYQFEKLGLGEPLPVSATAGLGIGEALDCILGLLPEEKEPADTETRDIRIAVIGRPNVGKSSFINRLIGEERVIVSSIPGTTRDAVDTPFELNGKKYTLIDTAGLKHRPKVMEDIDFYITLRTLRAIENCHIAVVLVDASAGLVVQDLKIIEDALEANRGIVLAVNKWDLIEKDEKTAAYFTAQIKAYAQTLAFIPIIYISSLSGQRVTKTISLVDKAYENWNREIPTKELNDFLEDTVKKQPPAAARGKYIKIFYATQTGTKPPTFLFFCNYPALLQRNYLRYMEGQFRDVFDFEGTPIRMKFRKR